MFGRIWPPRLREAARDVKSVLASARFRRRSRRDRDGRIARRPSRPRSRPPPCACRCRRSVKTPPAKTALPSSASATSLTDPSRSGIPRRRRLHRNAESRRARWRVSSPDRVKRPARIDARSRDREGVDRSVQVGIPGRRIAVQRLEGRDEVPSLAADRVEEAARVDRPVVAHCEILDRCVRARVPGGDGAGARIEGGRVLPLRDSGRREVPAQEDRSPVGVDRPDGLVCARVPRRRRPRAACVDGGDRKPFLPTDDREVAADDHR